MGGNIQLVGFTERWCVGRIVWTLFVGRTTLLEFDRTKFEGLNLGTHD